MSLTTSSIAAPQVHANPLGMPGLSNRVMALLQTSAAMQTPHTGRTLFDHLLGTHLLLESWGNTQAVCLAGLFHSIYGTNAFAHQSLMQSQRSELRAAIGEEAEALAWLFCSIDRPRAILLGLQQSYLGDFVELMVRRDAMGSTQARQAMGASPEQLQALAEIECANLIEQGSWGTALQELYCAAMDGTAALSDAALAALRAGWTHKLSIRQRTAA